MMDNSADYAGLADEDRAFDALQELERQTSEEIRRRRAHDRVMIKSKVVVESGNASEKPKLRLQGITGDVSEGGCRIMLPMPVYVGDIFRLTFDRTRLDLPLVFARCMRCRFIREDAFEAGFRFFTPVTVSSAATDQQVGLLI